MDNKLKVMIVEDDFLISLDLKSRLERLGHHVCAQASSAQEALENSEKTSPDLILMDITLSGGMDGFEAAALIRSRFEIPIIFITARPDKERLLKDNLTNHFGFLSKPFSEKQFALTMEMAFQKAKTDRERKRLE